jgi:3-hydroxyacyl-CoA dehydrogenase
MASAVDYQKRGKIALLTITSPPVNALGIAVRSGLADGVAKGLADGGVSAFVITGDGRAFCAGADIREFGKPLKSPDLGDVNAAIEGSAKPVVAALNGLALGGGLELAMACHRRVGAPGALCGQPEVKLGLVPGAGGTQRLPRLAGVEAALDMIVFGDPVPADRALELGILDEIIENDFVAGAIAVAEKVVEGAVAAKPTPERTGKIDAAKGNRAPFDETRSLVAKRRRGYTAPVRAIECIEAALDLPFAGGLAREREVFMECMGTDESKSMRHVFAAERGVRAIPDVPKDTPAAKVASAAVIGAGTMGGGIAMNFANAGIPVRLIDVSTEAVDKGLRIITKNYAATVVKRRLSQSDMDARMSLITGAADVGAASDADFVIEAVFEDMDIKKEMFRTLDATCKDSAILATNTSTLDIDEIAVQTKRPESVIGTHFFSPANVMPLLEIVRGAGTSKETIATAMKLAPALGKVGVLVGVCAGFVGNRMLHGYQREANFLIEEGAWPHQVDKVLTDFGFAMGPFAVGDLAGLDIGWAVRKHQAATRPKVQRYSPIADRICEMGRFGQKTGGGWYDYEPGSRSPVPNKDIAALIAATSKELGIERREIGEAEILERCIYPLINEGARILDEGIALRPGDIDIIWLNGYGFPPFRGGPMFYGDTVGLGGVLAAVRGYAKAHGDLWAPAPLLERLAGEGKGFADWAAG